MKPSVRHRWQLAAAVAAVAAGAVLGWVAASTRPDGRAVAGEIPPAAGAPSPGYVSLQAENRLMKKMLGQVEGTVVVMGPVDGGGGHGKLSWDTVLQAGYLHLVGLPPGGTGVYTLVASGPDGGEVSCGHPVVDAEGRIDEVFQPGSRLLKPVVFELRREGLPVVRGRVGASPVEEGHGES